MHSHLSTYCLECLTCIPLRIYSPLSTLRIYVYSPLNTLHLQSPKPLTPLLIQAYFIREDKESQTLGLKWLRAALTDATQVTKP